MFCYRCGADIPDGARFCPKCGAEMKPGNSYSQQRNYYQGTKDDGHGYATGSLVCGIIGVVLWFFGYTSVVSIILGIVGIVLSGKSRDAGDDEGTRTAGAVLSVISLVGGIAVFGISLVLIGIGSSLIFSILR